MSDQDTSKTVRLLNSLLSQTRQPDDQGDPVMLCHQNIPADEISDIRVVMSNTQYRKDDKAINAGEHIKDLLESGFTLMSMAIVRAFNYGETTRHEVMTVLVKKKNH